MKRIILLALLYFSVVLVALMYSYPIDSEVSTVKVVYVYQQF